MWRRLRIAAACVAFALCVACLMLWVLSYPSSAFLSGRVSPTVEVLVIPIDGRLAIDVAPSEIVAVFNVRGTGLATRLAVRRLIETSDDTSMYRALFNAKRFGYQGTLGFYMSGGLVIIPFWFLILVAGSLTAALKPAPRLRLSSRELFVVMTIIALVVGGLSGLSRLADTTT